VFFTAESLSDLGVVYQLGHCVGERCEVSSIPTELTLFDITGVHTVRITYCFCTNPGPPVFRRTQLMRIRWFPATWDRPGTAFTFRLLNSLHKTQTQSKVSLYDAYAQLVSLADPAGLKPPVVGRYQILVYPVDNPPQVPLQ